MLSAPLSERFGSVLRLTSAGPLLEARFTAFEVLTPLSAASPTLLTQRLFDTESTLKPLHFGEFLFWFLFYVLEDLFIKLDLFRESCVKMSLAQTYRHV